MKMTIFLPKMEYFEVVTLFLMEWAFFHVFEESDLLLRRNSTGRTPKKEMDRKGGSGLFFGAKTCAFI